MACDYLSIPGEYDAFPTPSYAYPQPLLATTVDVERVFSQGRLVLPHVHNRLSYQSTCALLCVRTWSTHGMVSDSDIKAALGEEVTGKEGKLPADWDAIHG
jgi:hypothetical protein